MQAPGSGHSEPLLQSTETSPAQQTTEPGNGPSASKYKPKNYPQKRYTDIATALGVIGTFGGGFSFTTLFAITCPDNLVRRLLEFAAVLFIGSLSTCIPVFCAVHGTDEKQGLQKAITKDFVRCHLLIAGILLLSALLCMFSSMYYFAFVGPFILAIVITGLAIISSIVGICLSDTDKKAPDVVRHTIPRENGEKCKRVLNWIFFGALPVLIILLLGLVCAFDPVIKRSSHSKCPTSPQCGCCVQNSTCSDPSTLSTTTSTTPCDPSTSSTTTSTTPCDPSTSSTTTSTTPCDPSTSSTATSTTCRH